jgi:DNA-binding NarL/FixJ family response regulator
VLGDDHVIVAEAVRSLLEECYEVVDIGRTGEALARSALAHRPDSVVSDIAFPDISGIEVLRQMISTGSEVPFLFLTMHNTPGVAAAAMAAGARGLVVKTAASENR